MATPAISLPQLTEQELKDRRYNVDSMLGTTLAEGVSPEPKVLELFEAYARGAMELDQILPAIKALDRF